MSEVSEFDKTYEDYLAQIPDLDLHGRLIRAEPILIGFLDTTQKHPIRAFPVNPPEHRSHP